jgi:VWFA-related protein
MAAACDTGTTWYPSDYLQPMRTFFRVIAVLLVVAPLLGQATSQRPPPQDKTPPGQPPVFRATTRLVQVNVVVHDSHGQPVTDLTQDDFSLSERGKPQRIAFFSMESATAAPAPAPVLPPHIFTNVLTQRTGVPVSVTVILLDLLNTSWSDQHYAREALVKFLSQIQPQDRIAIFALGQRSLTLLHDYTSDASSLLARMKAAKGQVASDLEASTLDPDTQQELRDLDLGGLADANESEADFFTTGRVVNTLAAFQAIAQHLSGLPGRQNVIWLSGGFPLTIGFDEVPQPGSTRDRRTFTPEMDAAVRALNNSNIAVYPVDARGLMVMPGFDASVRGSGRAGPPVMPRPGALSANTDAMKELADRTGGRAAYNTNDLARAIRRAIDDGRVTYTLGYYSSDDTQDGKFREIKVSVQRPHLDVRYRKGYFAMRPADNTPQTRQRDIRAAVWSPLESTAVAMTARVDFLEQPEPHTINVITQIDPSTLSFHKDGDRWKEELDIAYVQKDDGGIQQGQGAADHLTLALTDENYANVLKQGWIQQRRLPRQAAATTLRIVVRDVDSGSVGSLTVPFSQVPP